MGEAAARTGLSREEYLAFERASEIKHEYADGEIFAMTGGTRAHSLVGGNVLGEIRAALSERDCEVHGSDMRIKIPATGRYVYPDASVVCGEALFEDDEEDTLLNPKVIVEVLSKSTEPYDRGDKFENYQSLASLREYVLLSQKKVRVEHYSLQPDSTWILRVLGAGERLALPSIGCEIAVDRIYLKVFKKSPQRHE
jgi:Uma2 family endonuclease